MSSSATEYRWDIQALRAFAVVVVILFHSDVLFPNGYLGVDVFFVISGFVISRSVINGFQETGTFSARAFVSRRIRRLVPALCAMLCGSILISTLFESWIAEQWRTQSTTLVALFSFSNIWFLVDKIDYFSPSNEFNLLLHTWSLSVEEQFYVGFALAASATGLFVRTRRLTKPRINAILILLIIFSTAVFIRLTKYPLSPPMGFSVKSVGKVLLDPFYGTVARSWQFGVGILIALSPAVKRRTANVIAGLGFGVLLAVTRFWPSSADGNYWLNLLAVVAAAGICLRRSDVSLALGRAGRNPVSSFLVAIGDRSYSLYLWHWPFLVVANRFSRLDRVVQLAVAWTLTAVAADLSYRFVERRFMQGRRGTTLNVGKILVVSWSSVIGLFLAVWLLVTPALESRSGVRNAYIDHGCDPWMEPCPQGPIENGVVLLVGDSHAMAVSEVIYDAAKDSGLGVIQCVRECENPEQVGLLSREHSVKGLVVVRSWNSWNADQLRELEDFATFVPPSKTLVVHDNPLFSEWAPPSILGPRARGVSRAEALQQQTVSRRLIDGWSEKNNGLTADLLEDVCDTEWCSVRNDEGLFYIDDNHLSEHGLSLVERRLKDAVVQLLNP